MAGDKKSKDGPKKSGEGGYKWGSALIWMGGQWAVCWFITEDLLWPTITACFSAFFAGWSTSALLGRFAKWGANAWVMMILGLLVGVAIFSGAFSGLYAALDWWHAKDVKIDWDSLQKFLLSKSVIAPAVLGPITGLYVRAKFPGKK